MDVNDNLEIWNVDELSLFDVSPARALPVPLGARPVRVCNDLRTASHFGNDLFPRVTKRTYIAVCARLEIDLSRAERRNRRLIEERLERASWNTSPELMHDVQQLIFAQTQPVLQPRPFRGDM
jgi:hypothetical protein